MEIEEAVKIVDAWINDEDVESDDQLDVAWGVIKDRLKNTGVDA